MAIYIFETKEGMATAAAERIAAELRSAIAGRGEAHLVLSGGGTPRPVYERLATVNSIDWSKVHIWFADERNVPPDDPESNYRLADETLISKVGLLSENIHRMRGELAPENSAAEYSVILKEISPSWGLWPRFDVCILGMGGDGHTASLFPGELADEEFNRPVIGVTADYDGRPAARTTLTPLVINGSRYIIFLVAGTSKAEALKRRFEDFEPVAHPTQRILPIDGETDWFVDEAAASLL